MLREGAAEEEEEEEEKEGGSDTQANVSAGLSALPRGSSLRFVPVWRSLDQRVSGSVCLNLRSQ